MILKDFQLLENVRIIAENKSDRTMRISGLVQRADTPNQNNRIYSKKILENSINRLKPLFEGNRLFGELDHPNSEIVRLSNASHMITNLRLEGSEMYGDITLLPTPAGLTAQAILKGGGKLGISSRGSGTVTELKEGLSKVNDDYKMLTFDLVADPSVHDAFPGLVESRMENQSKLVEESIKKSYGEKVFLTLLEQKLKEGSMGMKRLNRKMGAEFKKTGKQSDNTARKRFHKQFGHTDTRAGKNFKQYKGGQDRAYARGEKERFFGGPDASEKRRKQDDAHSTTQIKRSVRGSRKLRREWLESLDENKMVMLKQALRKRNKSNKSGNVTVAKKGIYKKDTGKGTTDLHPGVANRVKRLKKKGEITGDSNPSKKKLEIED